MNIRKLLLFFGMLGVLTGCSKNEVVLKTSDEASVTEEVQNTATTEADRIYVYVCGCVENPGVYSLERDARICDALQMAGGVTKKGQPESLNQAEHMTDGQTIYVPGRNETSANQEDDGLVDINKADKEQLMTLPGIGESKADLILQYRQEHGDFETIENLMDIPGIKEGVFNKIKDCIKVS